ncbi:MAG: hypothetical protein Q4F84_05445 [Fibrobacter sp.]|nr:hypothetical protein [Fibrobacter sp.]
MIKTELITRSPLRILEKSTQGGVGKGNIGVISARKGVGKTACLVHIATDKLFQAGSVIHVSFAAEAGHIVSWYEDIFQEIARRYKLDNAMDIHDEITKKRVIMNYNQDNVSPEQVISGIKSMIQDANFSADLVMIDGYDFTRISNDDLGLFKKFAEELQVEIWFSTTLPREKQTFDENGFPEMLKPFIDNVAILIHLEPSADFIDLKLIKDHDQIPSTSLNLKLDPQILLIAE